LKNKEVKLGIVGIGGIGSMHAGNLLKGAVDRCRLTAVCDIAPEQLSKFDDSIPKFSTSAEFLTKSGVDAVLICTPHFSHTTIGIDALRAGMHVLVEKPISVHKADCERLIAAHKSRRQVFAAMFNQRTSPHFQKVKRLMEDRVLGRLMRVNWIITNWFRSETYYTNGAWRATWSGEGGGVLLNQGPHQLDMFQWLFGMPTRVRGFCEFGKWHNIEVEDDVTAYMQFKNGATALFSTSTGEAPGTNRLEITGENGKIVLEDGKLTFTRNEVSSIEFSRTTDTMFGMPGVWNIDIPVSGADRQHVAIIQNFVNSILDGEPLIAPAREGMNSVELANAMLLSSLTEKTIELPMDGSVFERQLNKLIRESKFVKKPAKRKASANMDASFNK